MKLILLLLAISVAGLAMPAAIAQTRTNPQKPTPQKPAKPAETEADDPPQERDVETIKVDTNLVTVPVIANSRNGKYIADLTKEEFKVSEDGVPQEIAFLATVNAPFHVVLMLDTSGSTREKLPLLHRAAISFIEQLSAADKVKIIAFDDTVRDLNDFTSDRAVLRSVVSRTQSGNGTKIYDAMEMALNVLRPINGRKAIVVFSDGVDWHSDSSTFDGTLRHLDETGVIVYPIRFDTRADTEKIARQQDAEQNGMQLPTSDVVRSSTPPTVPSDDPSSTPTGRGTSWPEMIFKRPNVRRPTEPQGPQGPPTGPIPDTGPMPMPAPSTTRDTRRNDSISAMLDLAYLKADSYLIELAEKTGGQVYRANTIGMLPAAFAAIAAELRTQYLLGYYPTNRNKDTEYRKIQVKTSRKDVAIRARPGYRARAGR